MLSAPCFVSGVPLRACKHASSYYVHSPVAGKGMLESIICLNVAPQKCLVGAKVSKWPIPDVGYDVQPVFNQFGAARAAYGQIRPNMAKNGRFGGPLRPPRVILVGAKGSKWPIPDVGYDVQPCSTSVQPIWGS